MHPLLVFRAIVAADRSPAPTPETPTITIIANPVAVSGRVGTALSLDLSQYVIVSDGGTPTYAVGILPLGLDITGSVLSGTPQEISTATVNVTVSYSNAHGTATPQTLVLEFNIAPAVAPTLSISPSTYTISGTQNVAITPLDLEENVVVTNPVAGSTLTFSSSHLPAGLSISSAGVISGTPTVAGITMATIIISYPDAESIQATVTFDIAAASVTYYYTISGATATPAANGDYYVHSGTHGSSGVVYTNGASCYMFDANDCWVINNAPEWDPEGPGPLFGSILHSSEGSYATVPTGTWTNGMDMPTDEATVSAYGA